MMNNDDFDALLAYAINEHRTNGVNHDDVWQQLNAGELTSEEVVELRRGVDSNEEIAHKLQLFAPMSEQTRHQTLQMLLDRYYDHGSRDGSGSSHDEPTSDRSNLTAVPTPLLTLVSTLTPTLDPPFTTKHDLPLTTKQDLPPTTKQDLLLTTKHDPRTRDSVTTVRPSSKPKRRRTSRLHWASVALALAAAVLLTWSFRGSDAMLPSGVMPGFTLEFRNDDSGRMRGSAEPMDDARCTARYRVDQDLSVLLRPIHPIRPRSGELAVALLAQREGEPARWSRPAPPQQGTRGHIQIEQPPAELGLSPGVWTLTFYVTHKGRRLDPQVLAELPAGNHPGVTVIETTVCIVE